MLYQNVLSPLRVGKHVLKNRISVSPTRIPPLHSGAKVPTEEAIAYWADRARTGAGKVTVTGITLMPEWEDRWDLAVKQTRDRLSLITERIHYHGAIASMQIAGYFWDGYMCSDGGVGMFGALGRQIPVDEMMRYRDRYVEAAKILAQVGFDSIFLHLGHSIPIAQFLSPFTNKRTDEYGGCFENRTRYILDILNSVRQTIGNDMLLEARISGTEYQPGGIDIEEGIRIGEAISPYLDILQVSAGMHNKDWMAWTHATGFRPRLPNIHAAEALKKSGRVKCLIEGIGAIRDLEDADSIIASGKADTVAVARALIADPEMIKKCAEGRIEDVTPCIQCMRCHDSGAYGVHHQCSVNPRAGLEFWIDKMVEPPAKQKKVAVIGGGPTGMRAALTAAERGHKVTLYEMSGSLGGLLKYAEHVSFKYPLERYIKFMADKVLKSSITVKLNTKATPEMIKTEGFDAVISAVGSEPIIPAIPGIEYAINAIDAHGAEGKLGGNVAIIGGGQAGIELALHLDILGKKGTVLEMQRKIAPDASPTQRGDIVTRIRSSNFKVLTYAKCTRIEPGKVFFNHDGVDKLIEADSIVLAVGMKPKTVESDSFMGAADSFAPAGDCNQARTLEWCTKEGYYAAMRL